MSKPTPKWIHLLVSIMFIFGYVQNSMASKINSPDSSKIKVIFDTDMGPDYDDIGAIALLHAFADKGNIEILATVASDSHQDIPATIEVYNKYFKKHNVPVGKTTNPLAPNFTAANNWNKKIIELFYPELLNKKYQPSVEIYRKVLAEQLDNSVTIVTVGFMTNIAELLKSKADKYSSLNGQELVNQKVKNWVAMAGAFPQGKEFNIHEDAESAKYAFENFQKPILFTGFEIGDKIKTGGKIADLNLKNSPVSMGYKINFDTYAKDKVNSRSSWDQTAVLIAADNPEKYFYLSGNGTMIVSADGSNHWEPNDKGKHRFVIYKFPYQKIEEIIDELMLHQPE